MKKTILGFCLASVAFVSILIGCKKDSDKPVDCTALATEISNASMAYANDPSSSNCTRLKDAYVDYLSSTCIPENQRAATQQALDLMEMLCP